MTTLLAAALAALALLFAVSAFGVMMARWASSLPHAPREAPSAPTDPHDWIWWKAMPGGSNEICLRSGDVWRGFGSLNWSRYPDGISILDVAHYRLLSTRLERYSQQIKWNTDEAKAKRYDAVFEREHQTQLVLLEQARRAQNAAYAPADPEALRNASELAQARVTYHLGPSYTCPGCQFSRVTNPGQICARCLQAQGSP